MTVACIFDGEALNGMFSEIFPDRSQRPEVVALCNYVNQVPYPRAMLWAKYVVPEPLNETVEAAKKREAFFNVLRRGGVRPEVVLAKEIDRCLNRKEKNSCDFGVVAAIYLAAKKADTIVLCAGDGNYRMAVEAAHYGEGCRIEIIAAKGGLSNDLKALADYVHVLDEHLVRQYGLSRPRGPANGSAAA